MISNRFLVEQKEKRFHLLNSTEDRIDRDFIVEDLHHRLVFLQIKLKIRKSTTDGISFKFQRTNRILNEKIEENEKKFVLLWNRFPIE